MKTETDKARAVLAKAQADRVIARERIGHLTHLHNTRADAAAAHGRAMAEHLTLMQRADLGEDVETDLVRIRQEIAQAKADAASPDVSDELQAAIAAEPASVAAVEAALNAVLEAEARSLAEEYAAAAITISRIEAKARSLQMATYGQIGLAGAGNALANARLSNQRTTAKMQDDTSAIRAACALVVDGLRNDPNYPIPSI